MKKILLSKYYTPREYQKPIFKAFEEGYKRLLVVLPRRAGKDISAWMLMIQEAIRKPAIYFYIFPSFKQGRRVIWDAKTIEGVPFIDLIPPEIVQQKYQDEMKIRLKNGSLISLIGSNDIDSLRGSNPYGIVFSEYAWSKDNVFPILLPILRGNQGWCLFISTPRGKNHFYSLWKLAQNNPETWFAYSKTVKETKHITEKEIEEDIQTGAISWDLAQQEYYCSWNMGISGIVYGSAIDRMYVQEQITQVMWQSNHLVNTAWDLGRDCTAIIFFQVIGTTINIIDYYEKSSENMEYFIKFLETKPYRYGTHFWPHDAAVKEWAGPKYTRAFKARALGLEVSIVKRVLLEDGIEYTRSTLTRVFIDETKAKKLIKCIEGYRFEFNERLQTYSLKPVHDWASHGASALMYMALSADTSTNKMTPDNIKKMKEEIYKEEGGLPSIFN